MPVSRLRNICILAHVDHGKTTCADNLISSNGIISRHSAGKIRYLDSRLDEQERQITMKSSSIALHWNPPGQQGTDRTMLVNLIDSPGHVDFTSEVSTAARLADGALVVVDVVEGVAAQTRTVLRQAWRDRVKTCLLLNKMDRLIVDLEMTPQDAYQQLQHIIEQVNAFNQQLLAEEFMARGSRSPGTAAPEEGVDLTAEHTLAFDDSLEEAMHLSPEKGNVAFGSAAHGWAFRIDTFAAIIAAKMGAKPGALQHVLWGDWTFSAKTKRAQRRSPTDQKSKPMFVQFVLEQLWKAYDVTHRAIDVEQLQRMQSQIPAWQGLDFAGMAAGASTARDLLSRWLPFSDAVLHMATECLPSPEAAVPDRLPVLCPRWFAAGSGILSRSHSFQGAIAQDLQKCNAGGSVVVYIAKFLSADLDRKVLTGDALKGDEDVNFVAMCRVFSGTLRPGQCLCVVPEDAGSLERPAIRRQFRIERLYVLMGRFLEDVSEVPAGGVVAVSVGQADIESSGGDGATAAAAYHELGVERCLTLCDAADGPYFETPYSSQAFALVRVSIEPQHITDLDALLRGLRLLHKADPSVVVEAMVTGENVLGCCGDEHLKRCVSDLQNLYARGVHLRISQPLVAVRESIAGSTGGGQLKNSQLWMPIWFSHVLDASTEATSQFSAGHNSEHEEAEALPPQPVDDKPIDRISMSGLGVISVWTSNRKVCFFVSCAALPPEVLDWMDAHAEELESVVHRGRASVAFSGGRGEATLTDCLHEISRQLEERMSQAPEGTFPAGRISGMSVTKGSRTVLLDATEAARPLWDSTQVSKAAEGGTDQTAPRAGQQAGTAGNALPGTDAPPDWMWPSALAGFRLASIAGPLCEEPMRGVAFILHGCTLVDGSEAEEGAPCLTPASKPSSSADPYGPMSGQLMSAMREACRYCLFRKGCSRICEAMLSLEVQCEQEVLGKVYAVFGKRRVRVLEEMLREGTSTFHISCHLPLVDSFGLALDLRAAASGHVAFHMAYSHWELSEDDPFQEASLTPDELEELGDNPMPPNNARKLIDAIRKRKGLPTDEKVVSVATKQRTVTRMK